MAGIRVQAVAVDHVVMADGNPEHGFLDISRRIGAGRGDATQESVLDSVLAAARAFCRPEMERRSILLPMELRDIDAKLSRKASSIRDNLPNEILWPAMQSIPPNWPRIWRAMPTPGFCTRSAGRTWAVKTGLNSALRSPLSALRSPVDERLISRRRWRRAARWFTNRPNFFPCRPRILAEICQEAGPPPGVLNLVNGMGERAGKVLTEHPVSSRLPLSGKPGPARWS